jgi:thiol:disulfide interchange protein
MSKLDLAKEQIAYLKLWFGIMVAVGGWLLSNFQSAHQLLVLADIAALIVICFGVYAIHNRIESKIAQLEEL